MYRGSKPKILPVIIVIIVVALVIAALITVGRMIFSGDSSSNKDSAQETSSIETSLLNQDPDRSVSWTVRGPIVADENFRSYQIIVSPSSRTYVVYSGYLDEVLSTKSYDNNMNAYEQFIFAINKTGITKVRKADNSDLRGVCATSGLAYKFETLNSKDADHSMWSSTCKDSPGTMAADPLKIQALFANQITDFRPLFNEIY